MEQYLRYEEAQEQQQASSFVYYRVHAPVRFCFLTLRVSLALKGRSWLWQERHCWLAPLGSNDNGTRADTWSGKSGNRTQTTLLFFTSTPPSCMGKEETHTHTQPHAQAQAPTPHQRRHRLTRWQQDAQGTARLLAAQRPPMNPHHQHCITLGRPSASCGCALVSPPRTCCERSES